MARTADGIDSEVGRRVRDRRKELGLSQTKLAEALGITFQQVQKYEKGSNRVSASRLLRISEILHVPVAAFFGGEQPDGGKRDPLMDFLATRDGQDLNLAFAAIDDVETRKRIVAVVRAIAEGNRDGYVY